MQFYARLGILGVMIISDYDLISCHRQFEVVS